MTGTQTHLSDILGRCVVEGNLIVYRGIIVDHTLRNDRIFILIDELPRPARRALFSASYSGAGRVELMWRHNPPASISSRFMEREEITVAGDRWTIKKSRLVPDE